MSNQQLIEELCEICIIQSRIIREQNAALESLSAVVLEEEKAAVSLRLAAITDAAVQ